MASSVIRQTISTGHVNWQEAGISSAINAATYGIFDAASVIGSTFSKGISNIQNGVKNYLADETGSLNLGAVGAKGTSEAGQGFETIKDLKTAYNKSRFLRNLNSYRGGISCFYIVIR